MHETLRPLSGVRRRLTAEEEAELGLRVRDGDEEARVTLVECNIPLAILLAKSRGGHHWSTHADDIIGAALEGLDVAARRFDPGFGRRFSTYASLWIRNKVRRCIAEEIPLIRVPRDKVEELWRFRASSGPPDPIPGHLEAAVAASAVSEFVPGLEDGPVAREAGPGSGAVGGPGEEVSAILGSLDELDRRVLRMRFGLDSGVPMSFHKIGLEVGACHERARQLCNVALRHARAAALAREERWDRP